MTKNNLWTLSLIAIIVFFYGCQHSPQRNYYLLSASTNNIQAEKIEQVVGLGPIEIPEYLAQAPLIRTGRSQQMQIADNDYWGEPLQEGITRVLAINLMNKADFRAIEVFPWRADSAPPFSLRARIYDLQWKGGQASINASWSLFDNVKKVEITRQRFVRTTPCDMAASKIVSTYSEFFEELSVEMNSALLAAD